MKTKLTFSIIALTALIGLGVLFGFKEGEKKAYISIFKTSVQWYLINEQNELIELKEYSKKDYVALNMILNEYSNKGYKLANVSFTKENIMTNIHVIFEKE